jgi:hypothetical protein
MRRTPSLPRPRLKRTPHHRTPKRPLRPLEQPSRSRRRRASRIRTGDLRLSKRRSRRGATRYRAVARRLLQRPRPPPHRRHRHPRIPRRILIRPINTTTIQPQRPRPNKVRQPHTSRSRPSNNRRLLLRRHTNLDLSRTPHVGTIPRKTWEHNSMQTKRRYRTRALGPTLRKGWRGAGNRPDPHEYCTYRSPHGTLDPHGYWALRCLMRAMMRAERGRSLARALENPSRGLCCLASVVWSAALLPSAYQ